MKVIKVNYSGGSQKYLIFSDYEDFLSYLDYNWKGTTYEDMLKYK